MLHRADEEGLIAISQPAHAWVSGQIARHWGNHAFPSVPEEVCLAAEQHDIGFLEWERNPALNPETGLPYNFLEMPKRMHLEIWTKGIQQMLRFGRYPAVLVSMHYAWLAKRGQQECPPEDQALVSEFVETQEALQTTLQTSLSNDFYYAPVSTPEILERNRRLVSSWDWISLLLCNRFEKEATVEGFPIRSGVAALKLVPERADGSRVSVAPWPFGREKVTLVCDGRRLLKRYRDEAHLREAMRAAAPVTLAIELTPD